jgi:hypothetical protein
LPGSYALLASRNPLLDPTYQNRKKEILLGKTGFHHHSVSSLADAARWTISILEALNKKEKDFYEKIAIANTDFHKPFQFISILLCMDNSTYFQVPISMDASSSA